MCLRLQSYLTHHTRQLTTRGCHDVANIKKEITKLEITYANRAQ